MTGPDAPGATPAERRAVLARELDNAAFAGWRAPRRDGTHTTHWLDRVTPKTIRGRALVRLAREHRDEFLALLAEERAAGRGGR